MNLYQISVYYGASTIVDRYPLDEEDYYKYISVFDDHNINCKDFDVKLFSLLHHLKSYHYNGFNIILSKVSDEV